MQRAEELADRLGEQVGHYVSSFGHNVLKWVARAREEAEDIWAEAQAIRERRRSAEDQSENAPPVKS
jgi:ubiquinone biosynthesis protein UbiJ